MKRRKEGIQNSKIYNKNRVLKAKSNVRLKILFPFLLNGLNLSLKI
jgi:hypothetical protein